MSPHGSHIARSIRLCAEVVRVIAVYTYHQFVGRIVRQYQMLDGHVNVGCIACHTNPARGIVAASLADCIYGILVPLVQQFIFSISSTAPVVASMYLVECLENEFLVIAGKSGSYLLPQLGNNGRVLLGSFFVRGSISQISLERVVVRVQNGVHTSSDDFVYNTCYLVQICSIDNVVVIHVVSPCGRNTYSLGSGRGQCLERCIGHDTYLIPVAPALLDSIARGVEMVT